VRTLLTIRYYIALSIEELSNVAFNVIFIIDNISKKMTFLKHLRAISVLMEELHPWMKTCALSILLKTNKEA
jgi:hypothetical protein